jgi:UDPglucose--hexose-1-phosphate uridylyltransferase
MHELRQNVATGEWVIIAPARAKRPQEIASPSRPLTAERPEWQATCPFCPGNEESELEVLRVPDEGPWRVRVIRNKYPALQREDEPSCAGRCASSTWGCTTQTTTPSFARLLSAT